LIKKTLLKIISGYYCTKADFLFWLYGPYGVCNVLKVLPYPHIPMILRRYGATIGKKCVIDTGFQVHRPDSVTPFKNLKIGDQVYIGHNILVDLTGEVVIDSQAAIGANCQIWTHTGDYTYDRSDYDEKISPVHIGISSVVYSGSLISCGVNISDFARVGAGSVVLKDVKKYQYVAGVPAKEIRMRPLGENR